MILYGGSMYVRDSTLAENKIMISGGVGARSAATEA